MALLTFTVHSVTIWDNVPWTAPVRTSKLRNELHPRAAHVVRCVAPLQHGGCAMGDDQVGLRGDRVKAEGGIVERGREGEREEKRGSHSG